MKNRRNAIHSLLIFCLVAGLTSGRAFFFHLAYVLALLLAGSFLWAWMSVNWIHIGRQTYARRAQVGRVFDEHFRVQNMHFLPKLWLEVRDSSTLPGHYASQVIPTLMPRRKFKWDTNTLCTRRGQFTLGPMTVNSGDPFGLFQFPRHINAISRVIVYPATAPIYEFAAPIGRLSGGQAVRRRTYEVTTNASGVREYAPGDSLNRIHWKTSARRGKLFVKDFELDPLSDVWLFLDMDREQKIVVPGAGSSVQANGTWRLPADTEEYCVTCAASVSEYFIDKGRAIGMIAYTPLREVVQPDRGDRQINRVLEILALARCETQVSLSELLALEGQLIGRDSTLIIVTANISGVWLNELEVMRRRGLHVIAVVIDRSSFGAYDHDMTAFRVRAEDIGIVVYPVRLYDDLTQVLSYSPDYRPAHHT